MRCSLNDDCRPFTRFQVFGVAQIHLADPSNTKEANEVGMVLERAMTQNAEFCDQVLHDHASVQILRIDQCFVGYESRGIPFRLRMINEVELLLWAFYVKIAVSFIRYRLPDRQFRLIHGESTAIAEGLSKVPLLA